VLLCSIPQEKRDKEIAPSLAQLSKDKKFYAVLNLIRRVTPVIGIYEFTDQIDGKTAADWATSYGRMEVADELMYRYSCTPEILTMVLKKQVEQLAAKMDSMNTYVKSVGI
jgi:hypothetical protein